jgi:CubicO group peptidase (beta-lactamase class C family)
MKKRKKILLAISALAILIVIAVAGLRLYAEHQMKKIPGMSAADSLNYTLAGKDDAVVTVGTIQNGVGSWHVYGKDGIELSHELHDYEIGSLTKTITASMIAELVIDGKLNLDDTIDRYLKLPAGNTYPTVQELLTHTSGYKGYYYERPMMGNFFSSRNSFYGITDEMVLDRIGKVKTGSADKSWRYSNFGFAVLGQILEAVNDSGYIDQARAFLESQGMASSRVLNEEGDLGKYWDWNPDDAYLAAGSIVSNIEDMLLYARHQLDNKGIYARTHTVLAEVEATPSGYELLDMRVDAMGMAWIVDKEHGFIWHNGATGSYNSYMGFCPETQTAVVVLSNLPPDYRIPATVTGVKLLEEMQLGSN